MVNTFAGSKNKTNKWLMLNEIFEMNGFVGKMGLIGFKYIKFGDLFNNQI